MSENATFAVECFELTLAASGCVLLWRLVLRKQARAPRAPSPLGVWPATAANFFRFLLYVMAGALFVGLAAGFLSGPLGLRGDSVTVFNGAAAQLGMLLGIFGYRSTFERSPAPAFIPADAPYPPLSPTEPPVIGSVTDPSQPASEAAREAALPAAPAPVPNIFGAGAATFLMALPVLMVTAKLWEILLRSFEVPPQKQDLIQMFIRAESYGLLGLMIGLAVLVAPLTEELVFRAGIFRFLRTRVPPLLALLLPALVFASLHVNWSTLEGVASFAPLVVLAIVFSLAYQRTGHIGTAIVAHALFNLNTIVMIFAGVGVEP